jgi:hypothetical protein
LNDKTATGTTVDLQQARYVDDVISRFFMRDNKAADETILTISKAEIDDLLHLSARLHRLAPYEAQIRSLVMQR